MAAVYPYGVDYGEPGSFDGTFSLVTQMEQVLILEVYRKLTTAPGVLDESQRVYRGQFWDTNTIDLKSFLGRSPTDFEKGNIKNTILSVFADEYRFSVTVEVTFDGSAKAKTMLVYVRITPVQNVPSIGLVFSVTSSTVSVERL